MEVPAYRRHYREQIHHLALQFVGIVFDGAGRGPVVWDARVPGHFQYEAAEVARCVAEGRTQSSVKLVLHF